MSDPLRHAGVGGPARGVSTAAMPFGLTTRLRNLISSDVSASRSVRLLRAFVVVVAVLLVTVPAAYLVGGLIRDLAETTRTTPRFDPPVLAGQNVPGPCSSG